MLSRQKKAVMGIGTLIIFISVILVAAVAAGVIISTAGLLQQKSLIVGGEAQKRLVNQIEVISILGDGNITAEKVNNFEITGRLGAGSNPIQLRTLGISLLTDSFDTAMTFQHISMDNTSYVVFPATGSPLSLAAGPPAPFITIDDRDEDGVQDKLWLSNSTSLYPDGFHRLHVELSNNNDPVNATANLELNFSADTTKFIDVEALIEYNEVGYGFITLEGYVNNSNITNLSANLTIRNMINECSFDQVARETAYCVKFKLGNDDTVLDSGEVLQFLFRTKEEHRLGTDEAFEITFYPDKGSLTRIGRRTPDVITTTKIFLFP